MRFGWPGCDAAIDTSATGSFPFFGEDLRLGRDRLKRGFAARRCRAASAAL